MNDGDRGRTDAQQPENDEATAASQWPLGDIEPQLTNLRAAAGLLSHLAASPHQIEPEELVYIASRIIAHHDRLQALWDQAWEERVREHEAQKAALAAAKARTAPGSKDEVQHVAGLWGLLAGAASVVLERAREAMPEGTRLLAGDATALRHAVAPIDAGLPPAESGEA